MSSALDSLVPIFVDPPPWCLPLLPLLQRLLAVPHASSVADRLNKGRNANSSCPRFVPHAELPSAEAYEAFIARTGHVPTRDNLHDLFNGLMWLSYPSTKWRMNALQAREIAARGASGPRGAVRDALTVLDENGVLLQAPTELVDALRARDWQTLFVTRRSDWQSARLILFGHALLEKLLQPRRSITAHVLVVDQLADAAVAESLTLERLSAKPLLPLPVLGVPGWWPENENPSFYEDVDVFRGKISRQDEQE